MATARPCLAQLSRICTSSNPFVSHVLMVRSFSATASYAKGAQKIVSKKTLVVKASSDNKMKNKKKGEDVKKKKKARTTYQQYDQKDLEKFSLLDAMRYIRAFEAGHKPTSVKYDIAVKFKSPKNGPVVRNRLRLPHPVRTDVRVAVICPADSQYAKDALAAGATLVGEEEIFEAVKDGRIEFDRCLCQTDSLVKMNKAGMGRILGPRQLMPSAKTGTVIKDPATALKDMIGAAEYRERLGVVRLAVGQLGFTPEEMQRNIKAFIEAVKKDLARLQEKVNKEVAEVVLSSTNAPGFPLSGDFRSATSSITPRELSTAV